MSHALPLTTGKIERFSYVTGSSSRHSPSGFPGVGPAAGAATPPNTNPSAPNAPNDVSPKNPPTNRPKVFRSIKPPVLLPSNATIPTSSATRTDRTNHPGFLAFIWSAAAQLPLCLNTDAQQCAIKSLVLQLFLCVKDKTQTYRSGSPRLVSGRFRFVRDSSDSCFSYSASSSSL